MPNPTITFFPEFDDAQDLCDRIARACWYLPCLQPERIQFYSRVQFTQLELPDFFHPRIADSFRRLQDANVLRIVDYGAPESFADALAASQIIICWKDDTAIASQFGRAFDAKLRAAGAKIYNIGPSRRMEGSLYIEVSKEYFAASGTAASRSEERFQELQRRHAKARKAFLLATGPSVNDYSKFDFSDAVSIICNSVINDDDLMEYVQPDILVFADPIFHFGCSSYASAFHNRLLDKADRYDFAIIIPLKYYHLFVYHFPELEPRTIALPYENDHRINLDLAHEFKLRTTDNILTFLMLPVASTLASTVHLLGCDGRPLDEDDYFWTHNAKTQFVGEMESIQKAHPSFFKIEYNEYYLRHCDTLETYLSEGERIGRSYVSLTFSHIPALIKRRYKFHQLLPAYSNDKDILVSINPDLEDDFGHFLPYDVGIAAASRSKCAFVSICSSKSRLESDDRIVFRPVLTTKTWTVRAGDRTRELRELSETLSDELTDLQLLASICHIYMYVGDIRHVGAILKSLSRVRASKFSASINLFWAHLEVFDPDFSASTKFHEYAAMFDQCRPHLNRGLGLYVDSPRLAARITELYGIQLGSWPMIGVTDYSLADSDAGTRAANYPCVVYCPATGQTAKGFDQACQLVEAYNKKCPGDTRVRFVLRKLFRDTSQNNAVLEQRLERISAQNNTEVVDGVMSDKEYVQHFASADIILLPYRHARFHSRTSACAVDALYFGKKIIAAQNTWIADYATLFGCGYLYPDGDIGKMLAALEEAIVPDQKSEHANMELWQREFGTERLVQLICGESAFVEQIQEMPESTSADSLADTDPSERGPLRSRLRSLLARLASRMQ